mmetsp:Transcript_28676/g.56339  ORF Transcript_28676/g.56339 Transcript_28676/m.56339 type:complete len:276 (-) Transcript_28676:610-1437(-)
MHRVDVKELIGAVSVRFRTKNTRDHKLSPRELFPQHPHERDRAPLSPQQSAFAESPLRSPLNSFFQPRGQLRRFPTRPHPVQRARHLGVVGRVSFHYFHQLFAYFLWVDCRRQAERQGQGCVWTKHITCNTAIRHPADAGVGQSWVPSLLQQRSSRSSSHTGHAFHERVGLQDLLLQHRCGFVCVAEVLGRDVRLDSLQQDFACILVLQAVQQLAHDAERRGDNATGEAGMDTLGQHLYFQVGRQDPSQRSGQPQLLVVATATVQADDQRGRPDL